MNIYWCHEKNEYHGLFVKAPTRGRAKVLYSEYVECRMIDVRTSISIRGIHEYFEGVIEDEKSLERYGLSYTNDYDESPDPLWCEDCQHFKNYPYALSGEGYCDIDKHETWYGCPICDKYEKKGVSRMTVNKYPCEKCEIKKAYAQGDYHWFDHEDCPYVCPFVKEKEGDTE